MCYSREFRAFDARDQRRAEEARSAEERRAGTIAKLLNEAKEGAEKAAPVQAPAKEAAPAK